MDVPTWVNHPGNVRRVTDVAQHRPPRPFLAALADVLGNRVEGKFGVVKKGQMVGVEGADLAHQFAADGAAGAGHQHPPAGDQRAHRFPVEHRLRTALDPATRVRLEALGYLP